MTTRWLGALAIVTMVGFPAAVDVLGQAPAASRTSSAASSTLPRTADGRPDLQGYWSNATYTPFERPAEFKDKEYFSVEEATAWAKRGLDRLLSQPADSVHYDDAIWMSEKAPKGVTTLRTSIIVDPPDGRMPPMNAEGQRRAAARAAARKLIGPADSAQTRGLSERCIYWGHEGPPLLPAGYNSNLQIVQSPGAVVVIPEMMAVARIIPVDGRPHLSPAIRNLRGDSRGRWDGDTLVVETTNFTDVTAWRGSSRNLKVTERFTLVDPETIRYQFTVEDPDTWDVAWKGEYPMMRTNDPIYEYACHEGNYGIANILRAQRLADLETAAAAPAR